MKDEEEKGGNRMRKGVEKMRKEEEKKGIKERMSKASKGAQNRNKNGTLD